MTKAKQLADMLEELLKKKGEPLIPPDDGGRFIVRLWDMFDGWMDLTGPLPHAEAVKVWAGYTEYGTKNFAYEHGDYYRIFPADTRMMVTPEFLGR